MEKNRDFYRVDAFRSYSNLAIRVFGIRTKDTNCFRTYTNDLAKLTFRDSFVSARPFSPAFDFGPLTDRRGKGPNAVTGTVFGQTARAWR